MSTHTMRAIRLTGPGRTEVLTVSEVPVPQVRPGWVRIRVRAFGVNESEVTSRTGGSSSDFSFPRILGIEVAGTVDGVATESRLQVGQQVVSMMGGMGRSIDGSYADFVLVREENVIPFASSLPWETIGALPEMFQTAYGSLVAMGVQAGHTVLIRGGTSTVGLSAIALARDLGATVIATTRNIDRAPLLREQGAEHVLVDSGPLAEDVKKLYPDRLDAALELVGVGTLPDTLRTVKRGGTVCFTGALGGAWTSSEFSPLALIPTAVRLTVHGGQASDLPEPAFAQQLDAIADGRIRPVIAGVYRGLDQVPAAQTALEQGHTPGKHVVVLD
jgi:NADPH:quinone reductase